MLSAGPHAGVAGRVTHARHSLAQTCLDNAPARRPRRDRVRAWRGQRARLLRRCQCRSEPPRAARCL